MNPGSDEPETMEKDTHELLDMWIQRTKGRAIYLAIREAADKWRTSQVHKVLKKHEFMLKDTLGVLTKCDDVRNSKIKNALTDQDDKLNQAQHGYIATMNAYEESHNGDLVAQSAAERAFFEEEGMGNLVSEGKATCDALVTKICSTYDEYLVQTWAPTTLRLLEAKVGELQDDLKDLGLPEADGDGVQDAVKAAAVRLAQEGVETQFDDIVEKALIPLEDTVKKLIENLTEGDKSLSDMQALCNASGEGVLLQKVAEQALQSVDTVENLLVDSVVQPLHEDVAGSEEGSDVRVGRFTSFVNLVENKARALAQVRMQALKSSLNEACQRVLAKEARPVYDLEARKGKLQIDAKIVADAISHIILGVKPVVDSGVVSEAVNECTDWSESCAEEREGLEEKLRRIEVVMGMDIFQGLRPHQHIAV